MDTKPREIILYELPNGRVPFTEWFHSLKDGATQNAIRKRLYRLEDGNLGEYRQLGGGLAELKLTGLGLRIYFAEIDDVIIVILCGGSKNTKGEQVRDIQKAREYLDDFKRQGVTI